MFRFEFLVGFRRRHEVVHIGGDDALVERAFVRVACDDGGAAFFGAFEEAFLGVEAEACFAGAGVRAVAEEAVFGEERTDVAIELDVCEGWEACEGDGWQREEEDFHEGFLGCGWGAAR